MLFRSLGFDQSASGEYVCTHNCFNRNLSPDFAEGMGTLKLSYFSFPQYYYYLFFTADRLACFSCLADDPPALRYSTASYTVETGSLTSGNLNVLVQSTERVSMCRSTWVRLLCRSVRVSICGRKRICLWDTGRQQPWKLITLCLKALNSRALL